ncbi:MAG: hypothetical protein KGZ35_00890 [Truepera sp.]|nr:hypothetical protein [Truepera sp.]
MKLIKGVLVVIAAATGSVALMLTSLSGCSNAAQTAVDNVELAEARAEALNPEGWIAVAPGFRYRHQHGGISFWITAPELTEAGLQQVEAHVEALARAAVTELDRFRLEQWEGRLAAARVMARDWQVYWPKLQQEYERILTERGVAPENLEGYLQPAAAQCSLGASAMPTTAGPGAKAYATADCIPGRAISGHVRTETTARAGNDWPAPCRDTGWVTSQCKSVAYGSSGCSSTALAEYFYRYSAVYFVQDQRHDSNSRCQ